MGSRGKYAGQRLYFRCSACSKTTGPRYSQPRGYTNDVRLTGRFRRRPTRGSPRSTFASREYVCRCGHTGWSNHVDLVDEIEGAHADDCRYVTTKLLTGRRIDCDCAGTPKGED